MKVKFLRELVALRHEITKSHGIGSELDKLLEGLLKSFSTNSPICIYIVQGGRIQFVNLQFQELTGYREDELIGMNRLDLVHPEYRELVEESATKIWKERRHYAYDYRLVKKDGGDEWVVETFTPIWYGTNQTALAYFMEVNYQKQTEEALRDSEEFSSNLLSNSPNPIIVINPDTSVRYVNPAFENLTGFSSSEVIGRKAPFPWWMDGTLDKGSKNLRKAMHRGMIRREELFQKKNGKRFWIQMTSVPVNSDGELKYCLSNWIEITEQKQLRENLQFYITEVTRAQEEERRRIAREIHDGAVQALSIVCTECDEILMKNKGLSGEIFRQLKQLRIRIENILEEVRWLSHELRPGLLDHFGLLPSLELLIKEVNKSTDVNCRLELITSERRISSEAELALFRIAQEAMHNVKKHSKATEAVLIIEFHKNKVKLSITDNGCGFKLPKVLSSFACEGKLGLIGMSERTRLLSGSFRVKSAVDKGTEIAVQVKP